MKKMCTHSLLNKGMFLFIADDDIPFQTVLYTKISRIK